MRQLYPACENHTFSSFERQIIKQMLYYFKYFTSLLHLCPYLVFFVGLITDYFWETVLSIFISYFMCVSTV